MDDPEHDLHTRLVLLRTLEALAGNCHDDGEPAKEADFLRAASSVRNSIRMDFFLGVIDHA